MAEEQHRHLYAIVSKSEPFERAPTPAQLEKAVLDNTAFRRALRTPRDGDLETRVQQVAMSLTRGEDIGWETHGDVTQVFIVVAGAGTLTRGTPGDPLANAESTAARFEVSAGDTWVIEPSTYHNVTATSSTLKLLTFYTPPQHHYGTLEQVKER